MNIGSGIYIRLIYHTICGNSYAEACFREAMYKSSAANAQLLLDKLTRSGAYLIAPAAVLGPNH